jgi:hypothetical protein
MNAFSSIHKGIHSKKKTQKSYTVNGSPTYTETTLNNYKIIKITTATSATITFTGISTIDILVVGGGGGGGRDTGGGGGGGGVIALSNISVTSGTAYTITVGNGGNAATDTNTYGYSGDNSVFGGYTAIGGGGGADARTNTTTPTGGCGGGGSGLSNNLTGGTATQGTTNGNNGYNGGNGVFNYAGGGGGGAGGIGGNANNTNTSGAYGGVGGTGYSSNITGTATYYAGGGGGGTWRPNANNNNGLPSSGGSGGGGAGGTGNLSAGVVTANTGGGGGGGGFNNVGLPANGGSGIIIIRYNISNFVPSGASAWWDASDPNGTGVAPSDGTVISLWKDKSGNGYDAIGGNSATYSAVNKCLLFSSNVGYTTSYPANPTTETMFVVFNVNSLGGILIIGSSASGNRATGITNVGSPNSTFNGYVIIKGGQAYGATSYGLTAGTTTLATTTVNTSSSQTTASLNGGTSSSASNISSFTTGNTYIGKDSAASQYWFTGKFMEMIIYNSVLSTAQIQNIEGYLAWKWGIQTSLPTNHPYYSVKP